MTFHIRSLTVLLAAVALILGVGVASVDATLLSTMGSVFPVPDEPDPTGGAVVSGSGVVVPFATSGFSGTLTSTVLSGDPSNAWGGLTFTYLLTNDSVSSNALTRMTVENFTGFLTDVSYQTGSGGIAPSLADRLTDDVVGFSFLPTGVPTASGVLTPGSDSALLVVQTDATVYAATSAFVIDGDVVNVGSFAPIPEPGSFCLAVLGVVCLSGYAWRRRSMA